MKSGLRRVITAAVISISTCTFSPIANADVILGAISRGCYDDVGAFRCGGSGNPDANYLTGWSWSYMVNADGTITPVSITGHTHSFFGFDLSGVTGTIIGASITFNSTHPFLPVNGTGDPTATLGLFDYTGNFTALTTGAGGAAAFTDLGSGILYASPIIPTSNDLLTIDLNSAALIDLNAAKGGKFAIGGAVVGGSIGTGTFANSIGSPPTLLTLKFDVPEPMTLAIYTTGVAAIVAARRRNRRRTA